MSSLVQPLSRRRTHTSSSGLRYAGRVAGIVVGLAGATALHLARQRGVGAWESLWAEDGSVFLTDANRDFAGTFFAQNGGYVHLVPRILAGVAALFPVEDAAIVMALAGSTVVALTSAFVYFASGAVLRSQSARLVLAATVLVSPVVGSELYANALNLHFYLLFACFWALFWQSETWAALAFRSTAALAATLSDPVSLLLLPLAVVGPVARRSLRAAAVSGFFLVGLATQLLLMRGGESPGRNWVFQLSDLPDIFSLRVAGGLLVGDRFLDDLWLDYGRAFSYAALVVMAVLIGVLLTRSDRATAAFALLSLAYAGLFFCVQLFGRGTGGTDPELGSFHLNGARYVLLPFLFITTVVLALIDRLGDSPARGRWTWIRGAALVWLVAVVAANYLVGPNLRSSGPRWQRELEQARGSCGTSNTGVARVLVAPAPPEVWFAEIPCGRLQSQRLEPMREG